MYVKRVCEFVFVILKIELHSGVKCLSWHFIATKQFQQDCRQLKNMKQLRLTELQLVQNL